MPSFDFNYSTKTRSGTVTAVADTVAEATKNAERTIKAHLEHDGEDAAELKIELVKSNEVEV